MCKNRNKHPWIRVAFVLCVLIIGNLYAMNDMGDRNQPIVLVHLQAQPDGSGVKMVVKLATSPQEVHHCGDFYSVLHGQTFVNGGVDAPSAEAEKYTNFATYLMTGVGQPEKDQKARVVFVYPKNAVQLPVAVSKAFKEQVAGYRKCELLLKRLKHLYDSGAISLLREYQEEPGFTFSDDHNPITFFKRASNAEGSKTLEELSSHYGLEMTQRCTDAVLQSYKEDSKARLEETIRQNAQKSIATQRWAEENEKQANQRAQSIEASIVAQQKADAAWLQQQPLREEQEKIALQKQREAAQAKLIEKDRQFQAEMKKKQEQDAYEHAIKVQTLAPRSILRAEEIEKLPLVYMQVYYASCSGRPKGELGVAVWFAQNGQDWEWHANIDHCSVVEVGPENIADEICQYLWKGNNDCEPKYADKSRQQYRVILEMPNAELINTIPMVDFANTRCASGGVKEHLTRLAKLAVGVGCSIAQLQVCNGAQEAEGPALVADALRNVQGVDRLCAAQTIIDTIMSHAQSINNYEVPSQQNESGKLKNNKSLTSGSTLAIGTLTALVAGATLYGIQQYEKKGDEQASETITWHDQKQSDDELEEEQLASESSLSLNPSGRHTILGATT